MDYEKMTMEELETRAAEIVTELADADKEKIEALSGELDAIEERKKVLVKELAEQRAAANAVKNGAGKLVEEGEKREMAPNMEIRNSHEYIEAFAKYVRTGNDKECRALLSENVSFFDVDKTGSVPVPAFVAEIVAEGYKESQILSRVRRMEAPGNVKVGFEYEAPEASDHTEGSGEVAEENLVLGIVNLVPVTYKKYVTISDEALDTMNGEAYLRYIYEEVTRGIVKAEESDVIAAILGSPSVEVGGMIVPLVLKTGAAPSKIDDFVKARALLSSAAEDLVIICTPAQYAQYRSLQMAAQYGVDPFDGLEVLFSDAASSPIIGDLSGVMINLPKGEAVEFKYDDKTLMAEDMVRVLGRQPAAIGVVGNRYFAKVSA